MKIPFDIKHRDKIKNGEYKVETYSGYPVIIYRWDYKDKDNTPILGSYIFEDGYEYAGGWNINGKFEAEASDLDLVIITGEEEPLTPLAELLSTYLKNDFEYFATKKWDKKKWNEVMNTQATELQRVAYLEKQKERGKMIVVSPEVWDNAISDAFENGKKEGEKQKELPTNEEMLRTLRAEYEKGVADTIAKYEQKEQKPKRERNKPKESWLEKSKYELAHEEELLTKRQKELSEIRALKDKEQKPVDNEKVEIVEMTDFEQSVYDLCPVLGIEEAKATASDLLELAKKTLLKTGKVVLASNYPEGCSFEDGFHLGYSEGFNAKQEQKPAEWSEEDEAMLKEIISFFKDGSVKLQHDLDLYAGFLEKRLKSLRPTTKE